MRDEPVRYRSAEEDSARWLDFTLRWLEPPVADKSVRVMVLDPDAALVARAAREKGERLTIGAVCDTMPAARILIARAKLRDPRPGRPTADGNRNVADA